MGTQSPPRELLIRNLQPRLEVSIGTVLSTLVDFGRITVGEVSRRALTLRNPSPTTVVLHTLRVTGTNASRFTLSAPCADAGRIEADASCAVEVGFAPGGADRAEGWIELSSDASNAPLVRLAGIGIAAPISPTSPADPEPAAPEGGGGALSVAWLASLLAGVIALKRLRRR